jgi:hypothetical protein
VVPLRAGLCRLGGHAVLGDDERVPAHVRVGGEQDTDIGGEAGENESAGLQEDQQGIEARREEAGVYGVG